MTTSDPALNEQLDRSGRARRPDERMHNGGGEGAERSARLALFVSLIQHGESVREAGRESGISADQVLQWLEDDPTVMAALETTRAIIQKQIQFRLIALAHKAVDTVDEAIAAGDARVAVEVLTGLGLLNRGEGSG